MKLTVLGCMGGYPTAQIGTSAYLVTSGDYRLLLDAGSGAMQALLQVTGDGYVDAVLLSHYHADHIADIGVLQYGSLLKPVMEQVPRRILPIYAHREDAAFDSLTVPHASQGFAYNPQQNLELGPFLITFCRTVHPVPCYAVRMTEQETGKTLVYTADSGWCAALVPFANQADVLLADCNFFNGQEQHPIHMTAGEVGTLAEAARVGTVVLTHLPAHADWVLLQQQAEQNAPSVAVVLANKFLEINW